MGLDNGILIRRKQNEKPNITLLLKPFTMPYDTEERYSYEVCYWRKCWNVRQAIIDHVLGDGYEDCTDVNLTSGQVLDIIEILSNYNEENWSPKGCFFDSIWTWEEHEPHNTRHIENLKRVYELMTEYPEDIEVWFYDSY